MDTRKPLIVQTTKGRIKMKTKRFFYVLVVVMLVLFQASGAVSANSDKPDQPNDMTQARLRVSNCVGGGDKVQVYFNGKNVRNGGVLMTVSAPEVSGYWYREPGPVSVAVVPKGQPLANAIVGPLNLNLKAGHRYTLVVLGQQGDAKHQSLVIDETVAYRKAVVTPMTAGHILINNIPGSTGMDFIQGNLGNHNVAYGTYQAARIPAGYFTNFILNFRYATAQYSGDLSGENFNTVGDYLDCFFDNDLKWSDTKTSIQNTNLDLITYMRSWSQIPQGGGNETFNTYLKIIQTAHLTDVLTNGGPFFFLAPTDAAFAQLPKATLDQYLHDPEAAARLVKYLTVPGFHPEASLSATGDSADPFGRTVTNMLGTPLALTGFLSVNGVDVKPGFYMGMVRNGTRFLDINAVAQP